MSTKSPTSTKNERRNLRFPSPYSGVIDIVRVAETGEETIVPALVIDESYSGIGCVLCGPAQVPGETFWYQENEDIRSEITVSHNRELDNGIQRFGFEFTGRVTRSIFLK